MKRDTALIAIIAVALLVVAFQTFELVGLTNNVKTTGLATAQAPPSSQSEYDQMMQQMHPDQVKQPAGTRQIGGC